MKSSTLTAVVILSLLGSFDAAQAAVRQWDGEGGWGWSDVSNWDGDTALPVSTNDSVEFVTIGGGQQPSLDVEFTIGSGQYVSNLVGAMTFRMGGNGVLTVASGGTLDLTNANIWEGNATRRLVLEAGATARAGSYNAGFADWTTEFIADASGVTTFEVNSVTMAGPLDIDLTSYNTNNGLELVLFDYGSKSGTFNQTNVTGFAGPNVVVDYTYALDGSGDNGIALLLDGPQPNTWDGGGGNNDWQTGANWSRDFVPTAGQDALVGSGYTVTNVPDSYGSLLVEAGGSVTMAGSGNGWNGQSTTVEGTLDFAGAFRLYGSATLEVSGSLGPNMTYLVPYQTATVRFRDGASMDSGTTLQLDDTPTIEFVLSATGFTTVNAGTLLLSTPWSDTTFNVDISAYDRALGTTITLMDFSGYSGGSEDTEENFVNAAQAVTGHKGGTLSWDADNDRIVLEIEPITGTLITVQ